MQKRSILLMILSLLTGALIAASILILFGPPGTLSKIMAYRSGRGGQLGDKERKAQYEKNEVKAAITLANPKIRECYLKFLATHPQVTDGRILVDWDIGPRGIVMRWEVLLSEFNSPPLEDCILDVVRKMIFPPPPNNLAQHTSFAFVLKKADLQ